MFSISQGFEDATEGLCLKGILSMSKLKKHKFIGQMHCPDCFDETMKRFLKWDEEIHSKPSPVMLSPIQYKACQKYGYPEGLLHLSEFKKAE